MAEIHPSAIVGDEVELPDDAIVGPNCVLTGRVTLGAGAKLMVGVCIQGPLVAGANLLCYPGANLGFDAQDLKIKHGDPQAGVVIGDDCTFRECATVHAATNEQTPTKVGDRVYFMVNAHAGHDSWVGDDVVLVNNVALGGHSQIHDRAILSGSTMVHQYGRVGRQAMTSGCTTLSNDLPPFFMAVERNLVVGLNLVGMRRSGIGRDEIDAVKRAFKEVFRKNPPQSEMREMLEERAAHSSAVRVIYDFVSSSKRPLCQIGGRRVYRATDESNA